MATQLPVIGVADLYAFHLKHFPHKQPPEELHCAVLAEAASEQPGVEEHEQDDLGCYPDGVKRTLTDEDIAFFRHSEIQRIIRERRWRRDRAEASEEEGEVVDSPIPSKPAQAVDLGASPEEGVPTEPAVVEKPTEVTKPAQDVKPGTAVSRQTNSGGIAKPQSQQWATSSARTKARNRRNRDRYKAKKRDERIKKEQAEREGEESDEWDPWHQATGPDVQHADSVDLDY